MVLASILSQIMQILVTEPCTSASVEYGVVSSQFYRFLRVNRVAQQIFSELKWQAELVKLSLQSFSWIDPEVFFFKGKDFCLMFPPLEVPKSLFWVLLNPGRGVWQSPLFPQKIMLHEVLVFPPLLFPCLGFSWFFIFASHSFSFGFFCHLLSFCVLLS